MKKIFIIILLIITFNLNIISEQLTTKDLIGSWFLDSVITIIPKENKESYVYWDKSKMGQVIKFLTDDMAIYSFRPELKIKCFYELIYIKGGDDYYDKYKIILNPKDDYIELYLKQNGDEFEYILIMTWETDIEITKGRMSRCDDYF